MSCSHESGAECAMGHGVLKFELFHHVMIDDELKGFVHGMDCDVKAAATCFEGCSTRPGEL